MRHGILISLAGSAALGVGALALAHFWTPGPQTPASDNPGAARKTVPVVIASGALGYGVRLEARNLSVAQFPSEAAPQGAYSSVDQVLNQAGGAPVVLAPLAAREPLLPAKLSGPGARPSLSADIAEGKRGYTIRVTDVSGVGGHALPGDHVDVVLTRDLSDDSRSRRMVSEVVIQNVRVLGIDLNANPTSAKAALPKTSTLEVTVEDAQKLAVASELGSLTLALRRSGAVGVDSVRAITASDMTGVAEVPAPRARTVAVVRRLPAKPLTAGAKTANAAFGSVRVIHGDKAADIQVPTERSGAGA
jgi:pilus assembly protein CpaB